MIDLTPIQTVKRPLTDPDGKVPLTDSDGKRPLTDSDGVCFQIFPTCTGVTVSGEKGNQQTPMIANSVQFPTRLGPRSWCCGLGRRSVDWTDQNCGVRIRPFCCRNMGLGGMNWLGAPAPRTPHIFSRPLASPTPCHPPQQVLQCSLNFPTPPSAEEGPPPFSGADFEGY